MYIQRTKHYTQAQGPDGVEITYWNDWDACWVCIAEEEATYCHMPSSKSHQALLRMLQEGNPGDKIEFVE